MSFLSFMVLITIAPVPYVCVCVYIKNTYLYIYHTHTYIYVCMYIYTYPLIGVSRVVLMAKNPPANAGDSRDEGLTPGLGGFPEKEMATTLVFLLGKSMELQRVRHD